MMDLQECRNKIDEIDQQLLHLLSQRMEIVTHVAEYKKAHHLPILNANREQEVIQNKLQSAPEEIQEYVKAFFIHLMEISKCYQLAQLESSYSTEYISGQVTDNPSLIIACQGTKGAYSHITSKRLFPSSQIHFYQSFSEVFDAVTNEQADYGVVPIENSAAGSVCDVYDLLKEYCLPINLTYRLKVEHCLAAKMPLPVSQIKAVYSKKEALEQCSEFLRQYPDMLPIPYANTALAAEYVSNSSEPIAAVCSEECAKLFHLNILQKHIQNISDNYTKFIVISKKLLLNSNCTETSICIRIPNQPGELNKLLTKFSLHGIDLTKLESRPIGDKDFSVLFYINFSGTVKDQSVMDLLNDLNHHYPDDAVKLLGSYENR